jgi:ribose transport system substrate-binding protein
MTKSRRSPALAMLAIKNVRYTLACLVLIALALAGCVPVPPAATPAPGIKVVVIGKSMNPYWSNVEKGVQAAGRDLGIQTELFVPAKEDVAAQIQIMETNIAQHVTGIAIAPSNPEALERVMRKAVDAGIIVTTLDTPPAPGSVSQAYIGTDNYAAGRIAGETMLKLLPGGGKVGVVRGSDTALNALQRTQGFLDAVKGTAIRVLAPLNDHEDAAMALQLANSVLSTHPDLAGGYGVYAYNGPAWATAIREARAGGTIKVVGFDATSDSIKGIKEGLIDAIIGQREYDMGYKSVQMIKLIAQQGAPAALAAMGAENGVISTGVDVITADNLRQYEKRLDARGIPHEWNTEGWAGPG